MTYWIIIKQPRENEDSRELHKSYYTDPNWIVSVVKRAIRLKVLRKL